MVDLNSKRPRSRNRRRRNLCVGAAALGALFSCGYDPGHSNLEWELDPRTTHAIEVAAFEDIEGRFGDAGGSIAQVDGALHMLFGTPQDPRYKLTAAMVDDDEVDYNDTKLLLQDNDPDAWDAVVADNRARRFRWQLELIAQGRYDEVTKPRYADELWERWLTDFAPLHTGEEVVGEDGTVTLQKVAGDDVNWTDEDGTEYTWHDEAIYLFETWYPSLRESAEMFRMQCLHCHGVNGDGRGPTAPYLEPRPRDYRLGKFKWVAVDNGKAPRREDVRNILERGVVGTSMPSFRRFSRGELEGLIDYVRLLSMRGRVETLLTLEVAGSPTGDVAAEDILETYEDVWGEWLGAEMVAGGLEVPRFDKMSAEELHAMQMRGADFFQTALANCASCHGKDGLGVDTRPLNAETVNALFEERVPTDEFGIPLVDADGNELAKELMMKPDEWGNDSNPRNFTRSIFRGGRRPVDIYRRIKYGIGGTIMPAAEASVTDEQIWDLVAYVYKLANDNDLAAVYRSKQAVLAEEREAHHGGDGHDGEDHDGDDHDHEDGEEEAGH